MNDDGPEVEIYWPAGAPTTALLDAEKDLLEAGLTTTCRVRPVRRGAELSVLVLVTTAALEPMLRALFERVGGDAYAALRRFVGRLLRRDSAAGGADARTVPEVVIFESARTGAQFVFTSGLPDDAYRAAVQHDPGPGGGRWVWDGSRRAWLRFEELDQVGAAR